MTLSSTSRRAGPAVADRIAADQLSALVGERSPDPLLREIGWSGPVGVDLPDETAVQAVCGIMHVHGRAAGRPQRIGIDYASTLAGVLATQGVLAASIARVRGARISTVRTSVAQAALLAVQQYLAVDTADDDWVESREAGARPPFVTRDGVRFELETLYAEDWQRFWRALGAPCESVAEGWWPFQQRFSTATAALPISLHTTVHTADYAAVRAAAASAGVSVLPLRDDPVPPAEVPACTFRTLPGSAPPRPVRTAAVPLDGLVVVESTRRIQGPIVGHVLGMLGADVVRIEPPGGDPMRGTPPMAGDCSARFRALNGGKRVVELDIKSEAGRRAVHELVAEADAFVHNWAPGKAEQFELDAEHLARSRPGLAYAWASGWSPLSSSEQPLGTDFLVQAHSGLAAASYPVDEPPAPSLMTTTDILGGLVCAEGVLAALLGQVRTGQGCRVDSSLFSASGVVPRNSRRPLWTELDRPLQTADGWLVLPESFDTAALAAALGSAEPSIVAERLREQSTDSSTRRLAESGIVATQVCTDLRQLARNPQFADAMSGDTYVAPRTPWEFS